MDWRDIKYYALKANKMDSRDGKYYGDYVFAIFIQETTHLRMNTNTNKEYNTNKRKWIHTRDGGEWKKWKNNF